MKKPPSITPPRAVRELENGHLPSPRKALGQHFLVDRDVLDRILDASELQPQDTVVEVGPGPGILTRHLVRTARKVIAIEIDSRLATSLAETLNSPPNLSVVNADARDVDLTQLLKDESDYKLVANLPYYAANPILRRFLESGQRSPSFIVAMVQKEVARSMVAERGRMSLLAVGIQLYGIPRIVCDVPPRAFYPPPKVTSAVVKIDVRPRPAIEVEDVEEFFDMVRAGFSAPRKQLHNSLSQGLGVSSDQANRLLELAGLDPRKRAENLSLEDWGELYQAAREMESWKSKPTPR